MCGIHGFIDSKLNTEEAAKTIRSMVESTTHRGPDNSQEFTIGPVSLGHNRLSIIDLSEHGNQPMQHEHLTIVFNGEIYNYKELRAELQQAGHVFKTDTDTEVILISYKVWGKECVNRYLGMWAFAIWDEREKSLFCTRDRFGIKPFYYLEESGRLYFASEVKSLKCSPIFSGDLNIDQLSRSMQLAWITYKDETVFRKVKVLEAGHQFEYKNDQLKITPYWSIKKQEPLENMSASDYAEQFRELILDSLKLHMRSDVPVGATLSGGIDSSSIVSSLIGHFNLTDLQTFSIFYEGKDGVDERPFIHEVENKYAGRFKTHFHSPDLKSVHHEFERITHHCDFPVLGSSPISQYFIMKAIAESGIKVVLSGQGADDYLGGYMHTYYRFYAEMLSSLKLATLAREMKFQRKFQGLSAGSMSKVFLKSMLSLFMSEQQLYSLEYSKYNPRIINGAKKDILHLGNPGFKKVDNFHYQLMNHSSLPNLLHYEDRNSMAFSIESRVPFLDHRLVEFAFRIPAEEKIHNGYTKAVLRDAMSPYLPEAVRKRTDKKGFVTPGETNWLRNDLKHMLEIDYANLPFLDKPTASRLISDFRNGDNSNAQIVWRMSSLNYWMKKQ